MSDLHAAAVDNDVTAIRALVAGGADVNGTDQGGRTPLFYAAHGGHVESVAALLELGAEMQRWDAQGEPLMHWAAEDGSPEVIRLLVAAGADVNQSNPHGWTALHEAALLARPAVVQELLEAGANVNAMEDTQGMTPLLLAARAASQPEGAEVARLLIACGADVTAMDSKGETALGYAARHSNRVLVDVMLAHGASHTLHSAVEIGDLDAVLELLAAGADPNAVDHYGSTPLHVAITSLDTTVALLRHGANPNARDSHGDTPLHVWVQVGGEASLAETLTAAGAQVGARNQDGETPLWCAAAWGDEMSVKVLLRLGADPTIRANDGTTPAEAARRARCEEVARMVEASAPGD